MITRNLAIAQAHLALAPTPPHPELFLEADGEADGGHEVF